MSTAVIIADEVFAWAFTLALMLAAVDWVRPLTVSAFFNVQWLELIAALALAVHFIASGKDV